MRILFVVTCANDIFIYNLAKWLKGSIECTLDAFELYPSSKAKQEDSVSLFDHIVTAPWDNWWGKTKLSRFAFSPIMIARHLDNFVKGKRYDIIHIQGVWDYVPFTKLLKLNTRKLFVSFWGSEHLAGKVWHSHIFFDCKLRRLIKQVDGITGPVPRLRVIHSLYPEASLYVTRFGIPSLSKILEYNTRKPKEESKLFWNIPIDKVSVLIGYSGKKLHNHLAIIEKMYKHPELLDKVHLLSPMTRGSSKEYEIEVKSALEQSGFSYSLIKDRFLSDNEIADLRRATDVVFQYADLDAYSRSIIESICAGALLVYGNWIKYGELLAEDGFMAIETAGIDDGIGVLNDYINHPNKYSTIIDNNLTAECTKYLWPECIKGIIDLYTGKKNAEVF